MTDLAEDGGGVGCSVDDDPALRSHISGAVPEKWSVMVAIA